MGSRTGLPLRKLIVGLGGALLLWQALPQVPHTQTLRLRLGKQSRVATSVRVNWSSDGEHTSGGFELHYPRGAPPLITHTLRLVDGDYQLQILATKRSGERAFSQRRVTLTGATATLRLHDLLP